VGVIHRLGPEKEDPKMKRIVDSWFGPRPSNRGKVPEKLPRAPAPSWDKRRRMRLRREREERRLKDKLRKRRERAWPDTSDLELGRLFGFDPCSVIKVGRQVWARWENGKEYRGRVQKVRRCKLLIAWDDGDRPLWVDVKDARPMRIARR
jgi:hypothetical protein